MNGLRWDGLTATAAIVLGALAFLVAARQGLRGVVVRVGG